MIHTLPIFLAASLLLTGSLAYGADNPGILDIRVIEGDNAVYPLGSRATRGVTVLVSDESGRPVEGATVSFSLPPDGPGGVFASGVRTEIATTRADGRAAAWGMRWNRTPGEFEIRVMAIKGQARAGTSVLQSLSDAPEFQAASAGRQGVGRSHHKLLWISLAAGAAAVAGIAGAGLAKGSATSGATGVAAAIGGPLQIGAPTITVGHP